MSFWRIWLSCRRRSPTYETVALPSGAKMDLVGSLASRKNAPTILSRRDYRETREGISGSESILLGIRCGR